MMKKSSLAPVAVAVGAVTVATVAGYQYAKARDFWLPQEEPEMASLMTLATSGTAIYMPEPNTGEEREILLPDAGSIKLVRSST
jgi:hypothetical protein